MQRDENQSQTAALSNLSTTPFGRATPMRVPGAVPSRRRCPDDKR